MRVVKLDGSFVFHQRPLDLIGNMGEDGNDVIALAETDNCEIAGDLDEDLTFILNKIVSARDLTVILLPFSASSPFLTSALSGESDQVHCIESERQELLKFKQDLKDPLNRLVSLAANEDCCRWVGVVYHNVTSHVHELHLGSLPSGDDSASYEGSKLGGKINPSLLDLKHLIYLDLSYNDFGGSQIPKFLGSIENLRYLNLLNAGFGGLIPHELGNLSNLHYLNVTGYYNNLYVMNLQWLFGLPLIQYLEMSSVNLTKATDWLQVTNKLPSLLELRLSNYDLSGFILPISNINFSTLTTLDLTNSWFQGPFPIGLQNMTSLVHLDLSGNIFNSSIPNWWNSFSCLEFLNLHSNNLQCTISSSIGNLTSAIKINLSINELGGKIPRLLGNLCNLREIKLAYNKWSQEISEILESLLGCALNRLEILDLTKCLFISTFWTQKAHFEES
nr:receptor-like protein EIX2 [Quercus suber]